MGVQTFGLSAARLAKYKGQILSHAVPAEVPRPAAHPARRPDYGVVPLSHIPALIKRPVITVRQTERARIRQRIASGKTC